MQASAAIQAAFSRSDRVGRYLWVMRDPSTWTTFESPLGQLTVVAGPAGIRGLYFPGRAPRLRELPHGPMPDVSEQLEAYFAGQRRAFELDLDLRGTQLQLLVWTRLREIPYGRTSSYGELAERIDASLFSQDLEPYERVRLVAATIGRTPTPILVPCHRVIGADGSLTGYGGGLERKRALLELEGGIPAARSTEETRSHRQLPML